MNKVELIKAEWCDLPYLLTFYNRIIDCTENMNIYARWKRGMHPTEQAIKAYMEGQAMYLYMDEDNAAGAMAVTMEQGDGYHDIAWEVMADDHEVAVIHILGVNPDYQGKGIGKQMIEKAIQLAKDSNKKAIRLDALASNIPAQHLYEGRGFQYKGKRNLFAENTGWTDFFFYEMRL
ncbi:Acetyltransferase (GNAT) family protein [Oscillibacter sp. PC13]|uniref:GNAT family N-acetyltransferase n=1 Tax=Oscillibacter sp. PC13 TaxID=1855299 RepID=UPI0008EC4FFB|nr:GNAT family N-acetyltransferase [Oscillibacter sp. PC13]SFP80531.1 Acetyltransferase (GNAT) family protein [Oscillibacter sp. PC13]